MSALDRHVKLQLEKHEEGSESIRGLILDSVRADPKEKTEPARTDENEPETTWFAQLKSRVQQQSAIDRRKKSKRRIINFPTSNVQGGHIYYILFVWENIMSMQ